MLAPVERVVTTDVLRGALLALVSRLVLVERAARGLAPQLSRRAHDDIEVVLRRLTAAREALEHAAEGLR